MNIRSLFLWAVMMIIALILFCAMPTLVAGAPGLYRGGEINVSVFGGVTTSDFEDEQTSAGVEVGYFIDRNFGVTLEGVTSNLDNQAIDRVSASLVFRIPYGKAAPYVFGGAYRDLERWQTGMHVGLGYEYRLTGHIGIFTDARMEKDYSSDAPVARARAGVRLAF